MIAVIRVRRLWIWRDTGGYRAIDFKMTPCVSQIPVGRLKHFRSLFRLNEETSITDEET